MSLSVTTIAKASGSPANHFFSLAIRDVQLDTSDAILVTFEVPEMLKPVFRFEPGQYLTLRTTIDGAEVRRSYSICAAIQDEVLRIAIKRSPLGLFSNWAFLNLKPGMVLEVLPPSGRFGVRLSSENSRNYVAFAAGSGITPIYSILKSTLIAEPNSRFTLFYGNRATSSIMLRNELGDLKDRFLDRFTLLHILTHERQECELLYGRIDRTKCCRLLDYWAPAKEADLVFLCGPKLMMAEITTALKLAGLTDQQIRTELFTAGPKSHPNGNRPIAPVETCAVTVILDGAEHKFMMEKRTESVLKAGLNHGLDLRYGCQGGVCSSCRAHLRSGKVDMEANYALEDYEIARGFILTCQSYPRTDELVVDFDKIH